MYPPVTQFETRALRLQPGVESFEPAKGRAMKEWVLVPLTHAERWADLAERAFSYVS